MANGIKMMLHETTRKGDFQRNTAFQHCCNIVSNDYDIVPNDCNAVLR